MLPPRVPCGLMLGRDQERAVVGRLALAELKEPYACVPNDKKGDNRDAVAHDHNPKPRLGKECRKKYSTLICSAILYSIADGKE